MNRPPLKKLYYSISEVSELTGVEPHVLRFWEKEFSTLRPRRGRSGNRTYKDRDIEIVKEIRVLLWDEKYTIQGAGERLQAGDLGIETGDVRGAGKALRLAAGERGAQALQPWQSYCHRLANLTGFSTFDWF